MKYRRLGTSDLEVPIVGFGTMSWPGCNYAQEGYAASAEDYAQVRGMVVAALECGMTLLDTAEGYGMGLAEDLLGRALEELGARDKVCLVTKVGPLLASERRGERICDLSPDRVFSRCEASLRRLRTDRIDLYLAHRPDPLTPIEETMGAVARLRKEGKIRWFGVSNFETDLLAAARRCGPVVVNQLAYSLADRSLEAEARPFCLEHEISIMAYSPMGKGVLSGKYDQAHLPPADDYRHTRKYFATENLPRYLALAARLRELAPQIGCTPAQLALAWVLAQPGVALAIPGAKSREQLRLNAAAAEVAVPADVLAELSRISAA